MKTQDLLRTQVTGYNVEEDGMVTAIRIFYPEDRRISFAEIKMAYRENTVFICWTDFLQRDIFKSGINGYTLFYDERKKPLFNEIR